MNLSHNPRWAATEDFLRKPRRDDRSVSTIHERGATFACAKKTGPCGLRRQSPPAALPRLPVRSVLSCAWRLAGGLCRRNATHQGLRDRFMSFRNLLLAVFLTLCASVSLAGERIHFSIPAGNLADTLDRF